MSKVPTVKLNSGFEMPMFGLGTWKSKPGQVEQAVKDAIDAGYRHIDCAHIYENENEVGEALRDRISAGVVKREDLFITSKLWNHSHRPDLVEPAIRKTLKHLGLEYLDMYLIHWPFAFVEGDELWPKDAEGHFKTTDVDYLDTWKAMEEIHKKGLSKSIGISNFNIEQVERVLANCTTKPAVNQIESNPYLTQKKLVEFCKSKGIAVTAYSPLGSPDRPGAKKEDPTLLDDEKIKEMAKKYNKTPAQVVLRYHIDQGNIVIPKSVTKSRIIENFDIFDFKLTPDEIKHLDSFDCGARACPFTEVKNHKYYPF